METKKVYEEDTEIPRTIAEDDIVIFVSFVMPFTINKVEGKYTFSESRVIPYKIIENIISFIILFIKAKKTSNKMGRISWV